MKIKGMHGHTSIACILFMASGSVVYAGAMGAAVAPQGAIYIGAFGGGGGITSGSLYQEGTALYPYGAGAGYINNNGPLAVNAEGVSNSSSAWLVGGQIGYRWPARFLNYTGSNWTFAPATELEGYYVGGNIIQGADLNNDTRMLVEHNFHVSYPLKTGVVLVNAILNANYSALGKFHPYAGAGMGVALISISGANSMQTSPSEPGVNHYNSDPNAANTVFAVQPKVGISFDLSQSTRIFAEYRFLYLAASNYTFGSTSYPTHVATTNWNVKIGSQYYNMGTAGIQFDL